MTPRQLAYFEEQVNLVLDDVATMRHPLKHPADRRDVARRILANLKLIIGKK